MEDAALGLDHGENTEHRVDDGTGGCATPGFQHDALLYDSAEEPARVAAPFLLEGLDAGDGAVIAVGPKATDVLREAVGASVPSSPRPWS